MRQKHLESALSSVQREFPSPNVSLEQYPTSPLLTASVVLTALQNGDLGPGRSALDLGCGTGMLALGSALVDCDFVLGVDCDESALELAMGNIHDMEMEDKISLILARVKAVGGKESSSNVARRGNPHGRAGRGRGRGRSRGQQGGRLATTSIPETRELILSDDDGLPLQSNCVDTVLTNPPFGTKNNAGMDIRFLRTATRLARRAVYSFHKSSTREFLVRTVKEWGFTIEVVAQMRFDLPQTYKFHKEKTVDVEVDLIRVLLPTAGDGDGVASSKGEVLQSPEESYNNETGQDESDDYRSY